MQTQTAQLIRRPNTLKLRAARPGGRTLAELRVAASTALVEVQEEFAEWVRQRLSDAADLVEETRAEMPVEPERIAALHDDIGNLADSAATFGHPLVGDIARLMAEVFALALDTTGLLGRADRRHYELLQSQIAAIRVVLTAGPGTASAQAGAALLPAMRRTIDHLAGIARA